MLFLEFIKIEVLVKFIYIFAKFAFFDCILQVLEIFGDLLLDCGLRMSVLKRTFDDNSEFGPAVTD